MNNTFVVEAVRASLGKVYLVGGAVRDTLLGHPAVNDYDFTTPLLVNEIKDRLASDGYSVKDFSAKYGTVSLIIAKTKVEVSTFRSETYSENLKQPTIDFVTSLKDDLGRRDFTMNAIAHDGSEYIDPFNGRYDIANQKIRTVGDAQERFEEDPLRMLRALRFVSELGFTLSSDTYDGIFVSSSSLQKVSSERISAEMDKLLVGKYWIQAMSLGIELQVFEAILNTVFSEEFRDDFIEHLSHEQDSVDTKAARWKAVMLAFVNAKDASSRSQFQGRQKALTESFDLFRSRLKWPKKFSELLFDRLSDELRESDLSKLESDYELLKNEENSRKYVIQEKILKIKVRQAFAQRQFKSVTDLATDLIAVQNKNLEIRIASSNDKAESIKQSLPYILQSVSYLLAEQIDSFGYVDTLDQLNRLFSISMKSKKIFDTANIEIGEQDRLRTIEDTILAMNRAMPNRLCSFSEAEIMNANKFIKRTPDRLRIIRKKYMAELVGLRRPPFSIATAPQRASLNNLIAELVFELKGSKDAEYYSHKIDFFKWSALSVNKLDLFWKEYEEMNKLLDIISNDTLLSHSFRVDTSYIYNATCLIYALTLTSDIDEKISFVRNIIGNYKLVCSLFKNSPSGPSFTQRNVERYGLLLDWLSLGKRITMSSITDYQKILGEIQASKRYHYKDEDEGYVEVHMPEIDNIRRNMYDTEAFLQQLGGVPTNLVIKDSSTISIISLFKAGIIDTDLAYEIYKNVIRSQIIEGAPLEPISILGELQPSVEEMQENENLSLIAKGESEEVEFKQSWRYDVASKAATNIVLMSALKAIAAFMNTKGGIVFVGVHDNGEVTGLEETDFNLYRRKKANKLGLQDEFKKNVDDTLHRAIGASASTLTKVSFDYIEDKTFAVIHVQEAPYDVFLENKFYVRNAASCRELTIKEYSEFKMLKDKQPTQK